MSRINDPDCSKPVGEPSLIHPCSCGDLTATTEVIPSQQEQKRKADEQATFIGLGVGVVMIMMCSGVFTSSSSSPSIKHSFKSSYATDEARLRELGDKSYPTQSEIQEYLLLDGRQAVREGSMSKSAYEQWTGQSFSD